MRNVLEDDAVHFVDKYIDRVHVAHGARGDHDVHGVCSVDVQSVAGKLLYYTPCCVGGLSDKHHGRAIAARTRVYV